MALVELHNIDPATAGRFLARLVEDDLLSAEQGLVLMDALQERTQGET